MGVNRALHIPETLGRLDQVFGANMFVGVGRAYRLQKRNQTKVIKRSSFQKNPVAIAELGRILKTSP